MRVVLDTNVLISALVFGGKPRQILNIAIHGNLELCISRDIINELQGVLSAHKFRYPAEIVNMIGQELSEMSLVVTPVQEFNIIQSEPDDNRILECAWAAKANYIVSGDMDLLQLEIFNHIPILSPSEFLKTVSL